MTMPLATISTVRHDTAPMRAVTQQAYGSVEVLDCRTVSRPTPGPGEVLVRVHAAGLDRGTWHLMTGLPRLVRLAMGLRRPRQPIVGRDLCGTVVEVGDGVTTVQVGQRVFGATSGSFAEYAVAKATKVSVAPQRATDEQAAVLGISGLTALQALDTARVTSGSRVLVIGASGGVGSYAVKLAVARGADVTAVCSAAKASTVREWGAQRVLDYAREAYTGLTYPTKKYYPTWVLEEDEPAVAAAIDAATLALGERPRVSRWNFSTSGFSWFCTAVARAL